ncbi:MAG: hypothetical protein Fur0037_17900 [Planctomycetota bacterium]
MRWLLAAISFALFVALAIATASVRAENARLRARIEIGYVDVLDCRAEWIFLRNRARELGSPERLAEVLRRFVEESAARMPEAAQP